MTILQKVWTQHGKVLGGSSSVNWMLYVRGHRLDYDSWAKLGCTGWDWENVQNYFKKMEDYFLPNGMIKSIADFSSVCFVVQLYPY